MHLHTYLSNYLSIYIHIYPYTYMHHPSIYAYDTCAVWCQSSCPSSLRGRRTCRRNELMLDTTCPASPTGFRV